MFRAATTSSGDTDGMSAPAQRSALISRLYREHNQSLVRFLIGRLGSEQEACEVAQEAYVRLLQLDQPGAIGYLRAFLFKTAVNLAMDRLRHRQVVRVTAQRESLLDIGQAAGPDDQVIAQQEVAVIQSALAELPPRCREVFLMSRLGGLGTREIARRLKVTERAIRLHLARAVLHCRERLDSDTATHHGRKSR
jgi:RNA polymerase sigma factor (sigma-70 family)